MLIEWGVSTEIDVHTMFEQGTRAEEIIEQPLMVYGIKIDQSITVPRNTLPFHSLVCKFASF